MTREKALFFNFFVQRTIPFRDGNTLDHHRMAFGQKQEKEDEVFCPAFSRGTIIVACEKTCPKTSKLKFW